MAFGNPNTHTHEYACLLCNAFTPLFAADPETERETEKKDSVKRLADRICWSLLPAIRSDR